MVNDENKHMTLTDEDKLEEKLAKEREQWLNDLIPAKIKAEIKRILSENPR